MHTFFVSSKNIHDKTCEITGDDARHLRLVLRGQEGDLVKISSTPNRLFEARIVSLGKAVEVRILRELPPLPQPLPVCLHLSLVKRDVMEFVVQKAVELNIGSVGFLVSRYSVLREMSSSQWNRLTRITAEAQKQCGRVTPLRLNRPVAFSDAVQKADPGVHFFLFEKEGGKPFRSLLSGEKQSQEYHVWIGPEGGWHEDEYDLAIRHGFHPVTLGPLVLKVDTAALCAISSVLAIAF